MASGAAVGFAVAGPLGALVGGVIGHAKGKRAGEQDALAKEEALHKAGRAQHDDTAAGKAFRNGVFGTPRPC